MKRLKFCIVLALCLTATTLHAQVNIKDSVENILHDKTADSAMRFMNAYNVVYFNSPSPEDAEKLALEVIYPFVQKTWKDNKSKQLGYLSRLYLLVSMVHRERGGNDRDIQERLYAEKALKVAVESNDHVACARVFSACAFMELKRGDVEKGHEYLYNAIDHYDQLGLYTKASEMLYVILSTFFDIKDTDGMKRVLQQMQDYFTKDTSSQTLYQYNVVKHSYFELVLEKEKKENGQVDFRLIDSMMIYVKSNINLVENFYDELYPNWIHGYAYYYLARLFDDYYPEQTDSVFHYLDKATDMMNREWLSRTNEENGTIEFYIYIYVLRAKALSRKGNQQEAYKIMSEALTLLDKLKGYNNLTEHRYTAYQFMADYYEKNNRPAEALKFQKLLRENEAQRYENEKIQAINDMSVKYETEKKEIQIQTLSREKITAQRILWLTTGLLLISVIASFLIIWSGRLKRKNAEQYAFEMALLAELRQNELDRIQDAKQQLEQNPIKNTIEKIAKMVSESHIEKNTQTLYLDRLSKIDTQLLENVFQSSKIKITGMDMKYIICFSAEINTQDMSTLFNIEPMSVHSVRYRIRKKFAKEESFRAILS